MWLEDSPESEKVLHTDFGHAILPCLNNRKLLDLKMTCVASASYIAVLIASTSVLIMLHAASTVYTRHFRWW